MQACLHPCWTSRALGNSGTKIVWPCQNRKLIKAVRSYRGTTYPFGLDVSYPWKEHTVSTSKCTWRHHTQIFVLTLQLGGVHASHQMRMTVRKCISIAQCRREINGAKAESRRVLASADDSHDISSWEDRGAHRFQYWNRCRCSATYSAHCAQCNPGALKCKANKEYNLIRG